MPNELCSFPPQAFPSPARPHLIATPQLGVLGREVTHRGGRERVPRQRAATLPGGHRTAATAPHGQHRSRRGHGATQPGGKRCRWDRAASPAAGEAGAGGLRVGWTGGAHTGQRAELHRPPRQDLYAAAPGCRRSPEGQTAPSPSCPWPGHAAPAAPGCSELSPRAALCPQPGQALPWPPAPAQQRHRQQPCPSRVRDLGSSRGSEQSLLFLAGGRSRAGLFTLLCGVQAKLFLPTQGWDRTQTWAVPIPTAPEAAPAQLVLSRHTLSHHDTPHPITTHVIPSRHTSSLLAGRGEPARVFPALLDVSEAPGAL